MITIIKTGDQWSPVLIIDYLIISFLTKAWSLT